MKSIFQEESIFNKQVRELLQVLTEADIKRCFEK